MRYLFCLYLPRTLYICYKILILQSLLSFFLDHISVSYISTRFRDSSVGIATRYGLDGPGIESRWGARFSAPVQTGSEAHLASYTMGTGSFLKSKRPERGVDHPSQSSAEVNERVELNVYSPSAPSWPVLGWTLLYFSFTFYISTTLQSVTPLKNVLGTSFSSVHHSRYRRFGSKCCLYLPARMYRGADKFLAQPGRKQARKYVRDARDFNKMETRAVIKFLSLQGKSPKEIHAILTQTLACFLPGRAKDLPAPLYIANHCASQCTRP